MASIVHTPYCPFVRGDDGRWHCPVCGANYLALTDKPPLRSCDGEFFAHKTEKECGNTGPGDHLHALILRRFGENYLAGCGCKAMVTQMNAWGPEGCRRPENMAAIIDKMMKEAEKREWKRLREKVAWAVAKRFKRPTRQLCKMLVLKACRMADEGKPLPSR
jgi:hypothetical protein